MQNSRPRREYEYIQENADKIPKNVKYQVEGDQLRCYVIQVEGLEGTNIHGAFIVADLHLPLGFPKVPPVITVRNEFRHINVYKSNKLCMYLVNDIQWITTTTVLDIIVGFNEVLHKPTPDDAANGELQLIYKNDIKDQTNKLNEFMENQTIQFRDPKYKVL